METWQKLVRTLCEIWVDEDIKSGKLNYEQGKGNEQENDSERRESFNEAA